MACQKEDAPIAENPDTSGRVTLHDEPIRVVPQAELKSAANANANVITMEGSSEIAAVAKKHFQYLGLKNIEQVTGNFDETLPGVLSRNAQLDFVFIDGNHRLEPTMRYFEWLKPHVHENTVLIFDDIHWSKEMELAWKKIQADEMVTLTIDLFFIGMVFFRKENKVKQHFSVRY